jgi:hypothetical protein
VRTLFSLPDAPGLEDVSLRCSDAGGVADVHVVDFTDPRF